MRQPRVRVSFARFNRAGDAVGVSVDHFGEAVAARYDEGVSEMFAPSVVEPAVDLLVALAAGGAALELGIGTGRIALPLTARGVQVAGIDLSEAMIARLHAKPGGESLVVQVGDFATTTVDGEFGLVYLVFNTVMNLTSQDEQVEVFRNAARHLVPGGRFVVEVSVPRLQRLPPGETVQPFTVTTDRLGFDEYDIAAQGLVSHHFWKTDDGRWEASSLPFRYVWPAELDLMARIAGMTLEHRWAGWDRAPFTSDSDKHVSVWRKDA
jgi:SAM-dependent methyltransferase